MQISLSKFSLFLTGVVSLGLVLGTGYLLYTIFFTGPEPDQIPVLTIGTASVFGPKLSRATAALVDPGSKVSLDRDKDLKFLSTPLYLSFTVAPEVVGLSDSRGRADPFVPLYVAP